ncbi:hypothetical protein [Nonomuraea sp. NPDC049400]|uniref:hypothetical protein n=1 Tax=Nonomuraea sp. NPDC049400 TaxID=3364352 RepID=UPI00379FBAEC
MNANLTLTLPDLAVRDRLCGAIVTDICRHVADAYLTSGLLVMADRWNTYIDTIDTTFPLAALLYRRRQPVGRHARNLSNDLVHLETSEMNHINKIYWPSVQSAPRARRPPPARRFSYRASRPALHRPQQESLSGVMSLATMGTTSGTRSPLGVSRPSAGRGAGELAPSWDNGFATQLVPTG